MSFEIGDRVQFGHPKSSIRGVVIKVSPTGRSVQVREDDSTRVRRFTLVAGFGYECTDLRIWRLHKEPPP